MILLGRMEVFNVSASSLFLFVSSLSYTEFLKTPSSAELHFNIALQRTNIVPGSKTVLRRLLPGSPRQVKSEDFNI